jgi:hypothetical protein
MKSNLRMTMMSVAPLFGIVFVAMITPAAASPNEYCAPDASSASVFCSFSTLEQCHAASSGRGGGCYRDPFLTNASGADGSQPKRVHLRGDRSSR